MEAQLVEVEKPASIAEALAEWRQKIALERRRRLEWSAHKDSRRRKQRVQDEQLRRDTHDTPIRSKSVGSHSVAVSSTHHQHDKNLDSLATYKRELENDVRAGAAQRAPRHTSTRRDATDRPVFNDTDRVGLATGPNPKDVEYFPARSAMRSHRTRGVRAERVRPKESPAAPLTDTFDRNRVRRPLRTSPRDGLAPAATVVRDDHDSHRPLATTGRQGATPSSWFADPWNAAAHSPVPLSEVYSRHHAQLFTPKVKSRTQSPQTYPVASPQDWRAASPTSGGEGLSARTHVPSPHERTIVSGAASSVNTSAPPHGAAPLRWDSSQFQPSLRYGSSHSISSSGINGTADVSPLGPRTAASSAHRSPERVRRYYPTTTDSSFTSHGFPPRGQRRADEQWARTSPARTVPADRSWLPNSSVGAIAVGAETRFSQHRSPIAEVPVRRSDLFSGF